MGIITNRYEFMFFLSCVNANPNGDPDMGNLPRVDPDTMRGIITDGAVKRRVRDYIEMFYDGQPGMDIFVQSGVNLNRRTAEAKEAAGVPLSDKSPAAVSAASQKACSMFWDVRTFGGVMSTGPNGGQLRGPVQIAFGQSLDSIQPSDIGITRVACADDVKSAKTAADYLAAEAKADSSKLRTMGRKQFAPYGLYEIHGFVSARLAEQTGFEESDLMALFEALANMYDATRTASKGTMSVVSPLIIFKHVGDPAQPQDVQARQAVLGRAPAYRLFELLSVEKKPGVETPRSHHDYTANVNLTGKPDGIEIGFLMPYNGGVISWNQLPDDCDWLQSR